MTISSPVFEDLSELPKKYTCDGESISPPLHFSGVPKDAKSLVLIVYDPDATIGEYTHWVVYNIDPDVDIVAENSIPRGGVPASNSSGETGYVGPCPPSGKHRYFFKLLALDSKLFFEKVPSRADIDKNVARKIIEETEIVGLYSRG